MTLNDDMSQPRHILREIHLQELDNLEDTLNKVFEGIAYFKRHNPDWDIKIMYNAKEIIIKYTYKEQNNGPSY